MKNKIVFASVSAANATGNSDKWVAVFKEVGHTISDIDRNIRNIMSIMNDSDIEYISVERLTKKI